MTFKTTTKKGNKTFSIDDVKKALYDNGVSLADAGAIITSLKK